MSTFLDWVARLWAPWTTENALQTDVAMHDRRLKNLETRMSEIDNALAELDGATNEVASELDALEQRVAEWDSVAAGRIRAAASKLRGLAADPENPVPTEQPSEQPADSGPEQTPDDAA